MRMRNDVTVTHSKENDAVHADSELEKSDTKTKIYWKLKQSNYSRS